MKWMLSCVALLLLLVGFVSLLPAADAEQVLYVSEASENLRAAPGGAKIGELLAATELSVLDEQGDWVEVQVTGWIWRDSTTPDLAEAERSATPSHKQGTDIAGGFAYSNVSFGSSVSGFIDAIGEMVNKSGTSYTLANFMVSVYDASDRLIGTGYVMISNFANGQTKSFNGVIEGDYSRVKKYKIQFENGI